MVAKKGFAFCGPSCITLHCPLQYIGSTCTRIVQNGGKIRYRNFKQLFESIIRKNQLAVHKIHTNSYFSIFLIIHTSHLLATNVVINWSLSFIQAIVSELRFVLLFFRYVCCTSLYQWDVLYHNYFVLTQIELHANLRQIITLISLYLTIFVYNAHWILLHIMFILV